MPRCRGFVLLPVVLAISLIAVLVLTLNLQSGHGLQQAAGQVAHGRARYVAEAGLRHAAWSLGDGSCAGYTALPATAFGSHSYQASIAPSSGSPVDIAATGTLAGGLAATLNSRTAVHVAAEVAAVQPGAAGLDALIDSGSPGANAGGDDKAMIEDSGETQLLLRFDLSGLPSSTRIDSAQIELYAESKAASAVDGTLDLHRVATDWSESGASWNSRDGSDDWSSAGGDYDAAVTDSVYVDTVSSGYSLDVTTVVTGWVSQLQPNYGVLLRSAGNLDKYKFATSEYAIAAVRPKLNITYRCECGASCVLADAVLSGKNLLMVVGSAASPASRDTALKSLIESWGYSVQLIDDGEAQSTLADTAAVDMVYVSASIGGATLADKLTGVAAPIVSEFPGKLDNFGHASGITSTLSADTFSSSNATHYISQPFAGNPVQVFTRAHAMPVPGGSVAAGLVAVGSVSASPALVTLEVGAQRWDGNPAPARRAHLPYANADVSSLTADGMILLKRSLEWAGGADAVATAMPALWLATRDDVSASGIPGLDRWTDGQALIVADPNLALEPGTTAGTFSAALDLDHFADDGNADIDALHYVNSNITVGGANGVDLQPGDVLFSSDNNESLTSINSLDVNDEDVFVFRPAVAGNYTAGNFIFLLDGSQIHSEFDTVGVTLVEADSSVGDATLAQGSFLIAVTSRRDVMAFSADDVGPGTTSGSLIELVDGSDMNLGSEISGLELAESAVAIGGHPLPAGSILLSLSNDGSSGTGDNNITLDGEDVFYLTLTQTGANTLGDATLLFEGSDMGLDSTGEHLRALSLSSAASVNSSTPVGLLAHWKLDDGTGNNALDSAGSHDGTLVGSPSWAVGTLGGALDFDGSGDYVNAGEVLPAGSAQLTIAAWVYKRDSGDDGVLSKASGTAIVDHVYSLGLNGTTLRARLRTTDNGGTANYDGGSISLNQWVHVAFSYDGAHLRTYRDGVETASHAVTGDVIASTLPTTLGNVNPSDNRYWNGLLDDVRLYDIALSAAEIAALAAGGGGGGGTPPPATVIEVRVAASTDDAEQRVSNGNMSLTSTDLEIAYDGSKQQYLGLRFRNVAVPQGATISAAHLQFQVDESNSGASSITLKGEASDDAPTFTSSRHNISSRNRTSAAVIWEPPPWTSVGAHGLDQRTPDIAALIQEIVDRPGWISGNDLAIHAAGSGERTAESYNGSSAGAPLLHIEY